MELSKFSRKQRQLIYWWKDDSPMCECDMVIADGAIRSGKTIAMICGFLQWSQAEFDNEAFIIAGKSAGALKRNVVTPMLQILDLWGWDWSYNRADGYIQVGTNTYWLFGANNEAAQDIIQGMTAAGALADDAALFPRSFIDQMIGRCSVAGARIWLNCNPRGPFHFLKAEFIDKAKKKRIFYLHFTMADNLSLSQKVKERYARMFSGVFFKRYILGLWVRAEGIIFDMFSESRHTLKRVPECDMFYVSCDYGTQNPTVFLLWGRINDKKRKALKGKWVCLREYYYDGRSLGKQKTDEEYYDDCIEFIGDAPVTSIIIDPSAASFIACVRKHDHLHVRKGKNAVTSGIRHMATALTQENILFMESCTETIKEFHAYVWDEKAVERGEDAPVKQNDHAMDACRYFVNTVLVGSGTSMFS